MDPNFTGDSNDKRCREETTADLQQQVPGGLFELLLPIWLFVKGFNLTASDRMRVARVSG
jgi:hypothetical protein